MTSKDLISIIIALPLKQWQNCLICVNIVSSLKQNTSLLHCTLNKFIRAQRAKIKINMEQDETLTYIPGCFSFLLFTSVGKRIVGFKVLDSGHKTSKS
jgi:hypothetical protein